MTVLMGYLVVELTSILYTASKRLFRSEALMPLEFVFFIVVIIAGSVIAGVISGWAVHAFDHPGSLAWWAFALLNLSLPLGLLFAFYKRGKFRLALKNRK